MKNLLLLTMSISIVLTGCKSGGGLHKTDSMFQMDSKLLVEKNNRVDMVKLRTKIVDISDTANEATKQLKRNSLLNELMMISNEQCNIHKGSIFRNQATWNIAIDTVSNVLSVLGTVANGEAIKANLAAGAAFVGSTKNLVSQEIYMKQLSQTVIMALDNARAVYGEKISLGMGKPYIEYPVYAALTDIQEYHRRCSFYYGLVEISKALSNKKPTTKEITSKIELLDNEIDKILGQDKVLENNDINDLVNRKKQLILERTHSSID
jgi:hypothetical protein